MVNFFDWPLEKAEEYPDCLDILRERVRPEVMGKPASYRGWAERWWQFWSVRTGLASAIAGLDRVLVIARVSKTVMPSFVPTGQVLNEQLTIFAYDDDAHLGLLSSSFHYCWAVQWGSSMRGDVRYTPSDVFETFPQPELTDEVAAAGRDLDTHRREMMLRRCEGLTKTYNRVHDPDCYDADVAELRRIHVHLDHAVAAAYGWQDLELGHGHHDTAQGVRFTVSPTARTELLDRLLELNHSRYAAEAAAGLHDRKKSKSAKRKPPPAQPTLDL